MSQVSKSVGRECAAFSCLNPFIILMEPKWPAFLQVPTKESRETFLV